MQMHERERETSSEATEVLRKLRGSGLRRLDCAIAELPSEANRYQAVVIATAVLLDGRTVRALGNACRDGLPEHMQFQVLAVAETRAKLRALQEAVCLAEPSPLVENEVTRAAYIPADQREGAESTEGVARRGFGVPTADASPAAGAGSTENIPKLGGSGKAKGRTTTVPGSGSNMGTLPPSPAAAWEQPRVTAGATRLKEASGASQGSGDRGGGSTRAARLDEPMAPEVLARLLHLTRRKAEADGTPITEEEAMRRINSFFQRAFGHSVGQGSRAEGQRLILRLTSGACAVPAGGPAGT
jgi:hypothetical protein